MKLVCESLDEFYLVESLAPQKVKSKITTMMGGESEHYSKMYINPLTLSLMNPFSRAISDDKGNLYVNADPKFETIHMDLVQWLDDNGYYKFPKSDAFKFGGYTVNNYTDFPDKLIGWQRADGQDKFVLAESYQREEIEENFEIFEEMMHLVQEKNPQYEFSIDPNERN